MKYLPYNPVGKTALSSALSLITLRKLVSLVTATFLFFSIAPGVVISESVICCLSQGVCSSPCCSCGETFNFLSFSPLQREGQARFIEVMIQMAVFRLLWTLWQFVCHLILRCLITLFCYGLLEKLFHAWHLGEGRERKGPENFLFGPDSVIFCGGPSVRQTYRTPSAESTAHV